MLPETYLGVDLSSFRGFDLSNMKRVVFNQNAYYSFGDFNSNTAQDLKNFYDNSLVLQVLTVSEDSHTFLSRNLGIRDKCLSRIVNSIERSFRPNQEKVKRMHWMPRKNSVHVQAILQSLQRSTLTNTNGWQGQPLHDLAHSEVADSLNGALLFLAFGHPEGFGLPIARLWRRVVGLLGIAVVVVVNCLAMELLRRSPMVIGQHSWQHFNEHL